MHVEDCCQALLCYLLPKLDRQRLGLTVDIGVGTFAFYCELFDKLKFKTLAVEPLPTQQLRHLCQYRNIPLVESCISEAEGKVKLYIGTYEGEENLNLNSLRSDWWGITSTAKEVPSMRLKKLFENHPISQITCLKIDVEGLEYAIIQQLTELPSGLLPKVLMFEYGGGCTKAENKGGWSEEILAGTMKSLEVLRDLGYNSAILVDSAADTEEQVFSLSDLNLTPESIFSPHYIYGNIIALRGIEVSTEEISAICQPYRNNQLPSPPLPLKEKLFDRALRKIRYLLTPKLC
ncbi:FkbM family methyltransferase [Oscillatoria sp. FACHB-1406]|uniref:FkbM family methyltransferase n=1 Tax=Oscillatoria sp. FACHB-1406 TaxID=2692846 RepID=UPI001682F52D|nr:FkbM family methyltransferase [Oscillatoria sp. FACHB-1406]MBD2579000.1 FkbM family methyltransferase [Oscillatoria sp. FACHB-1406]